MKPRILVLYYSMYGNTFMLAKSVCEGIREGEGEAVFRTVPELLPPHVMDDERIKKAKQLQKEVPVARLEDLENIDGIILGSPTRFGNMCSQLRNFLDQTGGLWGKGALIGKPAGVFCCTASLHGGQETTLVSMMVTLLHHGAVIVGVPYSVKELGETQRGGTPYGPTAVVGAMSDEAPDETELKIAKAFGKRLAQVAKKLQ
ncbi:MAG TPA: NAD(P)H:quinone oxidoreductase [Candidatus Omnitrophota bacterium]|mgnify:CR=1 FL=1|nr:NAD(P)H:quinone oxidoreductase [Candidatus Omnitrophota bacterium]HQO58883.1 NAD(P)H:quinone oxidoreductase [Candidatus Omnitrophota bacterium]HQP11690.1 NAD(P)H:quinone oxidoreductase [Candidatus Omnitrophota bacterium]